MCYKQVILCCVFDIFEFEMHDFPFTSFNIKAVRLLIMGDRLHAVLFAYLYDNSVDVLLNKVNGEN